MPESQILEAAATGIEQGLHPKEVAWSLAQEAYHISLDREAVTPFMEECRKAGKSHSGGKPDDITVIVSRISLTEFSSVRVYSLRILGCFSCSCSFKFDHEH